MTSAVYSKSVQKRVDELLAVSDRWAKGICKQTGQQYNVFASATTPGVFYRTRFDGRPGGCTCPAARKSRSGNCCHTIAVRTVTERAQAPVSLKSLRDLYPGCAGGCGNLADDGRQFCSDCAATRERNQRLAAARARVVEKI